MGTPGGGSHRSRQIAIPADNFRLPFLSLVPKLPQVTRVALRSLVARPRTLERLGGGEDSTEAGENNSCNPAGMT